MTTPAPAQVPNETPLLTAEERRLLLERLFDALLRHLLDALTGSEPVKASMLEVVRAFLHSNHITANSRSDMSRGLQGMAALRALPFNDPDKSN